MLQTSLIKYTLCSSINTAGQDATEAFYGLHRHEVLERPQYARLQIGVIRGEESVITSRVPGELSGVPYAEPTWLAQGYHSPYFKEVSISVSTPHHHSTTISEYSCQHPRIRYVTEPQEIAEGYAQLSR